jgi:aminoglycoside phosphotransferase (APT) family kinase protein
MSEPDPTILAALRRMRLVEADAVPTMTTLPGGVSSDIWRVDLPNGPVCVKRALPRLKVDAVWEVPIERNRYEWAWMQEVARIAPDSVPPFVAQDTASGCFVMGFLAPETYPVWKSLLQRGIALAETARAVGHRLVAIHAATADRPDLAKRFDTEHIFHAIRLEPYLLATARRHRDLAPRLRDLASQTAATKRALVHGDTSPKNVLVGPNGPVLLDAECAWYGDPAFDLAFCLNHLLLKCLWTPRATAGFLGSFDALTDAYMAGVTWEAPPAVERRAAHLLPGLLLARVDGKSPVEYLSTEADRGLVRRVATALLRRPTDTLVSVRQAWADALAEAGQ